MRALVAKQRQALRHKHIQAPRGLQPLMWERRLVGVWTDRQGGGEAHTWARDDAEIRTGLRTTYDDCFIEACRGERRGLCRAVWGRLMKTLSCV